MPQRFYMASISLPRRENAGYGPVRWRAARVRATSEASGARAASGNGKTELTLISRRVRCRDRRRRGGRRRSPRPRSRKCIAIEVETALEHRDPVFVEAVPQFLELGLVWAEVLAGWGWGIRSRAVLNGEHCGHELVSEASDTVAHEVHTHHAIGESDGVRPVDHGAAVLEVGAHAVDERVEGEFELV